MDDIEEKKKQKQQQQQTNTPQDDGSVKQDNSTNIKTLQEQTDNLNNNTTEENKKEENGGTGSPPAKRQKKSKGGQNKARPRTVPKVPDQFRICPNVHRGTECKFGDKCRFAHDVQQYMKNKPADVGENCVNYQLFGKCKYGVECRFAKNHLAPDTFENMVDEERYQQYLKEAESSGGGEKAQNVLTRELMNRLRKRQFKYQKTGKYLKKMALKDSKPSDNNKNDAASNTSAAFPSVNGSETATSSTGQPDGEVKENPTTATNTTSTEMSITNVTNGTSDTHHKEGETTNSANPSITSLQPTSSSIKNVTTVDVTALTPPASQQQQVQSQESDIKVQTSQPAPSTTTPPTTVGCVTDEDQIKLRACEKKKVRFFFSLQSRRNTHIICFCRGTI